MSQKKKTTIYDLADELGISVGTIYRALHNTGRISPTTKQLILDKAKEMNFQLNQVAQALRRPALTIGVLLCCPIETFTNEIKRGIDAAFAELEKFNVYPEIHIAPPVNAQDCASFIKETLNEFCQKKISAALVFLSGPTENFKDSFEQLESAHIPVATLVNDIPNSKRIIHVEADGFCSGQMAAELLRLCCKDQRVALLTGSDSTYIHHKKLAGFLKKAEQSHFSKVDVWEHYDETDKIVQQLDAIIHSQNSYQGVYITSASAIACYTYLEQCNPSELPFIITTGLFQQNKILLKKGIVVATIFQDPFRQGKQAVEHIYKHLCGEVIPETLYITPQIIFPANMDFYGEMLD